MKKYNVIVLAIAAACCSTNVKATGFTQEWVEAETKNVVRSSAAHAKLVSGLFYNDKELAARYVRFNQFYAKNNGDKVIDDIVFNHVIYPIVDHCIGTGMTELNEDKWIDVPTNVISRKGKKFIANNAQLIVSAGIVTMGRNAFENQKMLIDGKQFGRICAAQVGCAVVDEYVVKPAVKSFVGNDDSVSAQVLQFAGNYVLSTIVMNQVNKR